MNNGETFYNLMRYRKMTAAVSVALVVASLLSIALRGLNLGLDFTGGTVIEINFQQSVDLNELRNKVSSAGFDANVVNYGSDKDILIRLQTEKQQNDVGEKVLAVLDSGDNPAMLKRADFVGPQVGEELRDKGGLALIFALFVVMFYVAFRFQYKFSIGAVVALIHDVIISLGFFSFFHWEFDLTVLAALLAVIGYSLNDTIVVADRIRENFLAVRSGDSHDIINMSVSQTLGRTFITSLTTFFVVLILFFFGGEVIKGFALALIIGIIVGTYSSIYVAANVLLSMHIEREDLLEKPKEDIEYEGAP